jgi:hypothetical protein
VTSSACWQVTCLGWPGAVVYRSISTKQVFRTKVLALLAAVALASCALLNPKTDDLPENTDDGEPAPSGTGPVGSAGAAGAAGSAGMSSGSGGAANVGAGGGEAGGGQAGTGSGGLSPADDGGSSESDAGASVQDFEENLDEVLEEADGGS